MASDVEICNLALSHLAIATEIATLTERSKEAQACNRFYTQVRDEVLRDFPWPFATTVAALALVTDFTGVAGAEWTYAYRYPSDCVRARRILSGIRKDTRQSRVPFRILQDATGSLLYTDKNSAQLEYTARVTDPTRYQADFVEALALLLASRIAVRVTTTNPTKLRDDAFQLYQLQLGIARANALNEEQPEEEPDAELIRSRL
jgi:hypothetical protein